MRPYVIQLALFPHVLGTLPVYIPILGADGRIDAEPIHEEATGTNVAVFLATRPPARRVIAPCAQHTKQEPWPRLLELFPIEYDMI